MLRKIIIGSVILFAVRAGAIPPNELPFGSYDLDTNGTGLNFEQHLRVRPRGSGRSSLCQRRYRCSVFELCLRV